MKPETLKRRLGVTGRTPALRYQVGIVGLLGLAAFPLIFDIITISKYIPVLYFMMFAISWDLVSGYTGEISFGHTFFFAIGAYTTAVLNIQFGVHPLLSILIAVVMAAVGGILIGAPTLRLSGPYFSLITLIAPLLLLQFFVLFNQTFRGRDGFTITPDPLIGTESVAVVTVESFETLMIGNYYLAFGLLLVVLGVSLVITRSITGEILTAIRENERAVEASGLNPVKYKIAVFIVSAILGGLAGAVFVHSPAGAPRPSHVLAVEISIEIILMTVLGGMGTIVGAPVGAITFAIIRDGVKYVSVGSPEIVLPVINKTLHQLMPIPLYIAIILVMFYMPGGLVRQAIVRGQRMRLRWRSSVGSGSAEGTKTPLEQAIEKYREEMSDLIRSLTDDDRK